MTNTYREFRTNPDRETLLQMWCEFITAMAEDKVEKGMVMERLLRDVKHEVAIVELCGLTPSQLYAQVLARQENAS